MQRARRQNRTFSVSSLRRHYTNPFALYDALRAHDSIYFDASSRCWLVTGYHATTAILDDPRFTSRLDDSSAQSLVSRQMVFMDGEEHQRRQNVLLRPLAQMSKRMPDAIRLFAQEGLEMLRRTGEMDAVNDFAAHISLMSIAHVLGMPLDDHEQLLQLERWSDTFGDATSGYFHGDMQDVARLEDYFRQLIETKRRHPDSDADDLLSGFIAAKDVFPEDDDLISNCMMVFAAGRITTKKLLGNGIQILLEHWSEVQKLYQENPKAVTKMLGEELLRMVTPTRCLIRQAVEDVDLSHLATGPHLVRRGERLLLFLEAANYDPASFSCPDQFDPQRRPNRQVAFGFGPHQCPGATLARLEIQIALEALLSIVDLKAHSDMQPVWNPNPNLGGYLSFYVVSQTAKRGSCP